MALRNHIERRLKTGMTYTSSQMASAFFVSAKNVNTTLRNMQADAAPGDKRPRIVAKVGACPVWGWGVLPDYGTPELAAQMRLEVLCFASDYASKYAGADLDLDTPLLALLEYVK